MRKNRIVEIPGIKILGVPRACDAVGHAFRYPSSREGGGRGGAGKGEEGKTRGTRKQRLWNAKKKKNDRGKRFDGAYSHAIPLRERIDTAIKTQIYLRAVRNVKLLRGAGGPGGEA